MAIAYESREDSIIAAAESDAPGCVTEERKNAIKASRLNAIKIEAVPWRWHTRKRHRPLSIDQIENELGQIVWHHQ